MLKKILLALMFAITAITNVTHAEDDMKTAASKAYVDTQIETKQLKIPAANTPGVGAGETVMTYTSTGNGQIGERGLYSDISSYDATTDGDKLITASALNATFTNLPTTPTTKLECANQADGCTLWTIIDQTAYGKSRNLFNIATATRYRSSAAGNVDYLTSFTPVDSSSAAQTYGFAVKPNTTYTISKSGGNRLSVGGFTSIKEPTSSSVRVEYSYSGVRDSNSVTFTTDNDCVWILFSVKNNSPETADATNIQIEEGSNATPYEPYY